jgi:hypothetical protein
MSFKGNQIAPKKDMKVPWLHIFGKGARMWVTFYVCWEHDARLCMLKEESSCDKWWALGITRTFPFAHTSAVCCILSCSDPNHPSESLSSAYLSASMYC